MNKILILLLLALELYAYSSIDTIGKYTKNSQNTIYNSYSGLIWQDNSDVNINTFDWEGANNYCQNLELDGLTSWRLPTISELSTLRSSSDQLPFEYSGNQVFWSSTWDSGQDPVSRHWVKDFTHGYTDLFLALSVNQYGARCVIGDYYSDSFFDKRASKSSVHTLLSGYTFEHVYDPINVSENNESNNSLLGFYYNNGYCKISDNRAIKLSQTTNAFSLEWQIPKTLNRTYYDNAVQGCKDLVLDGYDDWRLPSAGELDSFFESNNLHPPYVQQDIFRHIGGTNDGSWAYSGVNNGYYWSSTSKWCVNFSGLITSSGLYTHGEGKNWQGAAANYLCVREGNRLPDLDIIMKKKQNLATTTGKNYVLAHPAEFSLVTKANSDAAVATAIQTGVTSGENNVILDPHTYNLYNASDLNSSASTALAQGKQYVLEHLSEFNLTTLSTMNTAVADMNTTATTAGIATGKAYVKANPAEFALVTKTAYDTAVADMNTTATTAGIATGKAYVKANPAEFALVTKTAYDTAVATATTAGENRVIASPSAYGLVSSSDVNSSVNEALASGTELGKAYVKNHPSEFNLVNESDIALTPTKISSLPAGWTLVSTPLAITDLSIFDSANVVWVYNNATAKWSAYSSDAATKQKIIDKADVSLLTTIPAGSGVWVSK